MGKRYFPPAAETEPLKRILIMEETAQNRNNLRRGMPGTHRISSVRIQDSVIHIIKKGERYGQNKRDE